MKYEVLAFLLTSIFVVFFLGYLFQPTTCEQPEPVTVIDLRVTADKNGDIIHYVIYKNESGEISEEKRAGTEIFYSLQIGDTAYVRYCKGDWLSFFHYTFFDGIERIEQ